MDELFEKLAIAIEEGEEDDALLLTQKALDDGIDPITIIQEPLSKGMDECGRKYNDGTYFLPELMLTGEAMKASLSIIKPKLAAAGLKSGTHGKVMMGAVEGDVHDLGKNICLSLLLAAGFETVDAGIDVSSDKFISLCNEHKPDIIGLGSYMSTTLPAVEEGMKKLTSSGFAGKILVGGVAINERWADEKNADGYADDAWGCVDLCKTAAGIVTQNQNSGYSADSSKIKIR
jgi:methanogenic corrinoid protein MtbC1